MLSPTIKDINTRSDVGNNKRYCLEVSHESRIIGHHLSKSQLPVRHGWKPTNLNSVDNNLHEQLNFEDPTEQKAEKNWYANCS
jgi:hypothetical protein